MPKSSASEPLLQALPESSLVRFMWAHRGEFAPGLTFAIARIVVIAPLPLVFKVIIDTFMPAKNISGIFGICAATVLALVVHHWLTLRGAERLGGAVTHLVRQLRALIFGKIQDLSFTYLDRERAGRLLSKYAFDTQKVDAVMMPILNSFLPDAIYSVITFGVLLVLNWKLSLVVLAILPMIALMRARYFHRLRNVHEVNRRAHEHLTGIATEFFGALRLLRSYGREEHAHETLRHGTREVARSTVRMIGVTSSLGSFSFAAMRLLTLIVIAGGALLSIHGQITAGDVLAFVAGVPVLVQPIQLFAQLSNDYFVGQEAYRSIKELLDEPGVEQWHGARVPEPLRGAIEFERVSFHYAGAERASIQDFSLRISPGEKIALVGPSGAGKSTVASLLLGLYQPQSGCIRIDGVPLEELDMRWLRRNTAIVLQETILLSGTIAENIRFAQPHADDTEVREAARLANASEFIERLPAGFETVIGERGATLSGGQRQRLAIARALLRRPLILILDEPTSALDYHSEALIQEALVNLTRGRTVVTIAHRLSTIRDADRVVVLRQGRIADVGTFEELARRNGDFRNLLTREPVG